MKMHTLKDLFVDQLKDLYHAEKQIVKALPKMAKAAENEELQEAFQHHLQQTEEHVSRLEQIFEGLGIAARGKKCQAMEGLIEEGKEMLEVKAEPAVRDAGLIAAAQRVEHYEMAGYGCARTFARRLGLNEAAELLQRTLDEEGETDKLLTQIAESSANPEAAQGEEAAAEAEELAGVAAGQEGSQDSSQEESHEFQEVM